MFSKPHGEAAQLPKRQVKFVVQTATVKMLHNHSLLLWDEGLKQRWPLRISRNQHDNLRHVLVRLTIHNTIWVNFVLGEDCCNFLLIILKLDFFDFEELTDEGHVTERIECVVAHLCNKIARQYLLLENLCIPREQASFKFNCYNMLGAAHHVRN